MGNLSQTAQSRSREVRPSIRSMDLDFIARLPDVERNRMRAALKRIGAERVGQVTLPGYPPVGSLFGLDGKVWILDRVMDWRAKAEEPTEDRVVWLRVCSGTVCRDYIAMDIPAVMFGRNILSLLGQALPATRPEPPTLPGPEPSGRPGHPAKGCGDDSPPHPSSPRRVRDDSSVSWGSEDDEEDPSEGEGVDDALDGDATGDGAHPGPRVRPAARPAVHGSGKCCGCVKRCAPSNCKCWRIRKEPCDGTCKPGETRAWKRPGRQADKSS